MGGRILERGLYIHIPFCMQKCNYCDFNSFKVTKEEKNRYLKNLIKEMKLYSEKLKEKDFTTLFLGGGTPTILSEEELEYVFKNIYECFNIKKDAEISIESNPGTLNRKKLTQLKNMGVNRISIGLQAFQEKHLKYLGRVHTYEDFEQNFKDAKEVGFENINVDLMFSLPNQNFEEWKETLEKVVSLEPTHISAYSLIIEEGTVFGELHEKGELKLLEEEIDLKMYYYTREYLQNNNYEQYEISNYAKKGYECRHNILYWECRAYLGLGPGAHSYLEGVRFSNISSLEGYFKNLEENSLPIKEKQKLNVKEKMEEKIFLGLRMNKGIDFEKFYQEFHIHFMKVYKDVVEKLKEEGLLEYDKNRIYLTHKGIDVSNKVFVEFLKD